MYRKYLQTLIELDALVPTPSTSALKTLDVPPIFGHHEVVEEPKILKDPKVIITKEFPQQNSIVGKANINAAKSVVNGNNKSPSFSESSDSSGSSEESIISSPRTFDPGGTTPVPETRKNSVVSTAFFLDEYIERERTPVFRRPPKDITSLCSAVSIEQESILSLDIIDKEPSLSPVCTQEPTSIAIDKPSSSTNISIYSENDKREPSISESKKSITSAWGPNGVSKHNQEVLLVKPIEDGVTLPIEDLLYSSFNNVPNNTVTSQKEAIQVISASSTDYHKRNHNNNYTQNNHISTISNNKNFNHVGNHVKKGTRKKVGKKSKVHRVKFEDEVDPERRVSRAYSRNNVQWSSSNPQTQAKSGWILKPICCGLSTGR